MPAPRQRKGPRRRTTKGLNKVEKKQVKRILNKEVETKFLDFTDSMTTLTASSHDRHEWSFDVAQGDGENQRVGNQVKIKGISERLIMSSSVPAVVRKLVILQNRPDFDNDLITAFNAMTINSQLPRETSPYQILEDKVLIFNVNASNVIKKISYKRYFNLKGKKQKYDGDTSSDNSSFVIQEIYMTDNTTASVITLEAEYRCFYKDM